MKLCYLVIHKLNQNERKNKLDFSCPNIRPKAFLRDVFIMHWNILLSTRNPAGVTSGCQHLLWSDAIYNFSFARLIEHEILLSCYPKGILLESLPDGNVYFCKKRGWCKLSDAINNARLICECILKYDHINTICLPLRFTLVKRGGEVSYQMPLIMHRGWGKLSDAINNARLIYWMHLKIRPHKHKLLAFDTHVCCFLIHNKHIFSAPVHKIFKHDKQYLGRIIHQLNNQRSYTI